MALSRNTGLLHPTDYAFNAPDYVDTLSLVASTTVSSAAQAVVPPSGAAYVLFGSTIPFYVSYGSTLVVIPATTGPSTSGASFELINPSGFPMLRNLGSTARTTALGLISSQGGTVTLAYYKV